MKRLAEQSDHGDTFSMALLQSAQVLVADEARKHANWIALQTKRPRRMWVTRPLFLGSLFASTALASTLAPRLLALREPVVATKAAVVLPSPNVVSARTQEPVVAPTVPRVARPARVTSDKRHTQHTAAAAAAEMARKADSDDEVLAAIRLLRAGRDPELTSALAEMYLHRHPDGALVEEALAVLSRSYERQAPAKAQRLALVYLQRFPQGAYALSMRRLAGPPP